jgi:putative membrane protein
MSDKERAMLSQDRNYTPWVVALTILINLIVVVLFFMPKLKTTTHFDLTFLPMLNAIFNSFTTIFLLAALYFIKKKNMKVHRRFIYAAFTSTTLFLITYLTYHSFAESTSYGGEGPLKYVYYFVLITHIVLAAPTVLLALLTAVRGLQMKKEKHRKIARWTMPIWLYVSITGVVVYLLISPYYS